MLFPMDFDANSTVFVFDDAGEDFTTDKNFPLEKLTEGKDKLPMAIVADSRHHGNDA
jgi:hypothetical protein